MAKFTNPRRLLSVAESGMFDLMLESSELLKQVAKEGIDELLQLSGNVELTGGDEVEKARDGLHKMVTYTFTLGVQFAVNRQQEMARDVAKKLGLIEEPKN